MNTLVQGYAFVKANLGTIVVVLTGAQLFFENLALKRHWRWAAVIADIIASIPLAGRVPGRAAIAAPIAPAELPK
jgi:hypothetical protein